MKRDDATERQVLAATPTASTWVSANAGSGKTRVLTDRVARLLLLGVPPEKVLCLTYTKAAAAEMQNRLFRRLGEWTMLPDNQLRKALGELGGTPPDSADDLREARRLFARAIEAPGGLKIQTIHSFASALLRRFPLEAGVSPDFTEMDDRAQALLCEEIIDEMAEGECASLVEGIARYYTGEDFAGLIAEISRQRETFYQSLDLPQALAQFDLPQDFTEAQLLADVFLGAEADLMSALIPHLQAGKSTDVKAADGLAVISDWGPSLRNLEQLEKVLLTGKGAKEPFCAKIGKFPTKDTRQSADALMPALEALMLRVEAARPRRLGLLAAGRSHALHAFAAPFLERYENEKLRRGWLDFDDLILKAGALLKKPGVAEWVLFRLDGGIDHILVDEAQDTSPAQWEVIRLIAEEFSAGESARSSVPRTIFVVGDMKQSIYSFQGADPANFGHMAQHFGERLAEVEGVLNRSELLHSFRTAPAILRAVDQVFTRSERNLGLGGPPTHVAFHEDKPGRVDLWPVIPKPEKEEDPAWYDAVDRMAPDDPDSILAQEIAQEIKRACEKETLPLPDGTRRPLAPGDFLILVQRRSALFAELILACKQADLPIAGADRLRLGGELAVKDLAALLSFLATPEDDLSLAAALKSPLFGWSEDQLYHLAAGRGKKYLWEVLREADAPKTLEVLNDLRREADFLRPYELLERVLIRHDGRRKLLARLGPEAEDGIDSLLAQAMSYENMDVPSLTGFLHWMQTEDVEVKRQLEQGGGVVRVMTVHGAKGLEAPVVILPDTRSPPSRDRGEIVQPSSEAPPLWKTKAEEAPPVLAQALEARKARMAEERMRLLYVAMTRAESWLIVAGSGDTERGQDSWYGLIEEAMEHLGGAPLATPTGPGLRFDQGGDWNVGPVIETPTPTTPDVDLAPWVSAKVAHPAEPQKFLVPSDLGGAKALFGEEGHYDEEIAIRRGRQLHLLFEHLPDATGDPAELARNLLTSGADAATPDEVDALFAEAMAVLRHPDLTHVFSSGLSEVEITASLPGVQGRRILGVVDRLIVTPEHVLVVDYKTNAVVPGTPAETPEGVLRQMGAYAEALEQIYPDRQIEVAILWTSAPCLMTIPGVILKDALARVTVS